MIYQEIRGNLITLAKQNQFDIIAHGCNCFCTQGAGIALQMSEHFDTHTYRYEQQNFKGNINKLGLIEYREHLDGLVVINAYTQFNLGKDLNYNALKLCLLKINSIFAGKHIGLPQIGCGIAGGSWEIVRSYIFDILTNMDTTIVIYDGT